MLHAFSVLYGPAGQSPCAKRCPQWDGMAEAVTFTVKSCGNYDQLLRDSIYQSEERKLVVSNPTGTTKADTSSDYQILCKSCLSGCVADR